MGGYGTQYCLHCEQYFCGTCKSLHKRKKVSRNHKQWFRFIMASSEENDKLNDTWFNVFIFWLGTFEGGRGFCLGPVQVHNQNARNMFANMSSSGRKEFTWLKKTILVKTWHTVNFVIPIFQSLSFMMLSDMPRGPLMLLL